MGKINEGVKYSAKLISIAFLSFLKISLLPAFSTILVISIDFILLSKDINSGHSAHVSATPFLVILFSSKPVGTILWFLTIIVSPFLFFTLTNKYVISKLSHKLINDKSESIILPILDKFLSKFQEKQPKVIRTIGDYTHNKLMLINSIQRDQSENKWLKKIILFGLKKIQLDDIDFNQEGQNFYEIIKLKTIQKLKEISEPSKKIILAVLLIQWLILLFIWLTKY